MKIYNTLTRQKEELTPSRPGRITIYACGPTVYNFIHIGNARPLCVFDVLRRYLQWRGWQVTYVQNFTDIEDKIIRRAAEEGVTAAAVAERFIAEYQTDAAGLGVLPADIHPRATENIDEILAIIGVLVEKGCAYAVSGGDVYFDTAADAQYGQLSRQSPDERMAGARIAVDADKRHEADFVLWKASKPGEPSWASPWGAGRPGWHIECSAMVRRYLGDTVDIHCGGQDLIFPHHENEAAQSRCCNGAPLARYWMHNGMINIDSKKMSKSQGNFFTLREVAAKYGYEPIRFYIISSGYRAPINFTSDSIAAATASLERLAQFRDALAFRRVHASDGKADAGVTARLDAAECAFVQAMDDDLNTADALSAVFALVRDINTRLAENELTAGDILAVEKRFEEWMNVLGLLYSGRDADCADNAEIEALIAERTAARAARDWATADRIRDRLKEMKITLEDTPHGVKWRRGL